MSKAKIGDAIVIVNKCGVSTKYFGGDQQITLGKSYKVIDTQAEVAKIKNDMGLVWWIDDIDFELDNITITRLEYAKLVGSALFLEALEEAGVDSWSGYDTAERIMDGWDNPDEIVEINNEEEITQ